MTKHQLSTAPRKILGRKVKQLRNSGLVPATVFGKNVSTVNLQLSAKDFQKTYREVGESTLIYLQVEGEKTDRPVLVSEVTRHPVTGLLLHVSFHQVDLKTKVSAPVAVKLTGESPAAKDKLGILVHQLDEIEVEALPTDMPEHIDVDISVLSEVNQAIYVKDLKLASQLTIKSDPESIIAKIEPLAAEEKIETPAQVEGEVAAPVEGEEPKPEVEPQATQPK